MSIDQARTLLEEMKKQAQEGSMIPFRVPGQIDEIIGLLDSAGEGSAPADTAPADAAPAAAGSPEEVREQVLEEMSQFISIAVHEMRIPLTSIRGYSDMLSKKILGDLNDQQGQFMETIRSNVLRMDRLIADVNDIAKIRAGRLHLDTKMDMPKNLLMGAEKENKAKAEAHHITLLFEVPDGLPLLNVDSARVTQALNYLIENAIFYSPEGSTVTVTASNDNGRFRVDVKDEGVGMTAEELPHLGEPFWRSETEVVRSVKGHGLGYAVAKGVIEAQDGEMFVQTEPEKGSTFGFVLPAMS